MEITSLPENKNVVSMARPARKDRGRWNVRTRSLAQLWCEGGLELFRRSAVDPLSGQEKWRRLAEGRFGFFASCL